MARTNADASGVRVDASVQPLGSLASATFTLTGGSDQLPANTCDTVLVQADAGNTQPVRIGGADGQHYPMTPGTALSFDTDSTADVWLSGTAGEHVHYLWLHA